jgi:glycosyltransferase involved in cell wall biosynthesis
MPNILIEVGALGIPVIAPTVGGVGELIDNDSGYPLPERPSVEDYDLALRAVLGDPVQALARAGRLLEKITQRHSWEGFVASVADLPGYLDEIKGTTATILEVQEDLRATVAVDKLPVVSVVIPCFNQGRYLYECISSVLAACSHPLEIIVVDDGSTDGATARYLTEAEQLAPGVVHIHQQANQGLSGARNSGISLARGHFLQLLDADDVLAPGKIDAQVSQLRVNPKIDVSVCNFLLCDESRSSFSKHEEAIARFDLTLDDFLYRWERGFVIPIHCGLFRRSVLESVQFHTSFRAKEDWFFWTTMAWSGTQFGYIHGHWAVYRQHEGSMRGSFVNMGRSWLQAGLTIDAMLEGSEPLFFESVVSWFEQCYRSDARYRDEIAKIHTWLSLAAPSESSSKFQVNSGREKEVEPELIVGRLSKLSEFAEPPLISVVVPIYGHYEYLQGCLESLAEQGDVSIEIICVDDASPDPRVTRLMNALKDRLPRLKIFVQPSNCGISEAQNIAVSLACGEFVAFLDCDDVLMPNALAAVRRCLHVHPEVDYLFTDRFDVDEGGRQVRLAHYGGYENLVFSTQENIRSDLLKGMVASHLKVIRRSVYLEVGGCDGQFSGVQDWDLALKIAEKHCLHYLAAPLYKHRVHSQSVTRSDMTAQFRKTNQVRRNYFERWLRPKNQECSDSSRVIIPVENFQDALPALNAYWKQGKSCVADAKGELTISQINFLREFNSYFDEIIWDDPRVPCALYGYLCQELLV